MGPKLTRRRGLVAIGLAATAGATLLTPAERTESLPFGASVSADTWPVPGRDPARTKHAPDATPPTSGSELAWQASCEVPWWNPKLAVGPERVYVPETNGLVALDRRNGAERWRFDTTERWPDDGIRIHGGPVIAGDAVLVTSRQGVLSLDTETGRPEWLREYDGDPRPSVRIDRTLVLPGTTAIDTETGDAIREWSTDVGTIPVAVVAGQLITWEGDSVAAFDPSGRRNWHTSLGEVQGIDTDDTSLKVAGTDDALAVGSNPMIVLDPTSGRELWRYGVETDEDTVVNFYPATDGRRIFVSDPVTDVTIAFDAVTGERLWQGERSLGLPVVANDTVYWFDEGIVALAAADGRRRGRLDEDVSIPDEFGTLAAVADRLYAAVPPREYDASRPTVFALEER